MKSIELHHTGRGHVLQSWAGYGLHADRRSIDRVVATALADADLDTGHETCMSSSRKDEKKVRKGRVTDAWNCEAEQEKNEEKEVLPKIESQEQTRDS